MRGAGLPITRLTVVAYTAVLIAICVAAQNTPTRVPAAQPFKIRVIFPEGISTDDVWLTYGLYSPSRIGRYIGLHGPAAKVRHFPVPVLDGQGHLVTPAGSAAFYEIEGLLDGKPVERFQAFLWAPGCKTVYFDVPAISADVEEHFVCTTSKEVTLAGRVRGGNLEEKHSTLWVSYDAGLAGCFQLHTCDNGCALFCTSTTILDIASANIAIDGSFKVELPDFSDDPISRGPVGFLFSVGESGKKHICLEPESRELRSALGALKPAPSYPGDLIFLPSQKCKW